MYRKPVVRSESIELLNASGQYIFEITPACPGFFNFGTGHTAEGLVYCAQSPDSNSFSADISCQNIAGEFHVVYGAGTSGGGLSCTGGDQSFVDPILSVTPELPANCIVSHFIFDDSFDECSIN